MTTEPLWRHIRGAYQSAIRIHGSSNTRIIDAAMIRAFRGWLIHSGAISTTPGGHVPQAGWRLLDRLEEQAQIAEREVQK